MAEGTWTGLDVHARSAFAGAGDRVKTDRRDAERLVRLLRLGELTAVRVPPARGIFPGAATRQSIPTRAFFSRANEVK